MILALKYRSTRFRGSLQNINKFSSRAYITELYLGPAANVPGTPILGLYQLKALRAAAPTLLPGLSGVDFERYYGLPASPPAQS